MSWIPLELRLLETAPAASLAEVDRRTLERLDEQFRDNSALWKAEGAAMLFGQVLEIAEK